MKLKQGAACSMHFGGYYWCFVNNSAIYEDSDPGGICFGLRGIDAVLPEFIFKAGISYFIAGDIFKIWLKCGKPKRVDWLS